MMDVSDQGGMESTGGGGGSLVVEQPEASFPGNLVAMQSQVSLFLLPRVGYL